MFAELRKASPDAGRSANRMTSTTTSTRSPYRSATMPTVKRRFGEASRCESAFRGFVSVVRVLGLFINARFGFKLGEVRNAILGEPVTREFGDVPPVTKDDYAI